jgi:import receptor subunit TOM22
MVEFEEIKDEHYEGDGFETEDSDGDYSDTSSEGNDDLDPSLENESLFDRIAALKDVIPAPKRHAIARTLSKSYSYGSMAAYIGGKAAYVLITSVLLLGIPYALALEEDKMLGEQERQMQLQQGMSEVSLL